ncbi:sigma 54-interacting transcriptional regulator [Abyssisolibacter fermentans]|uniref:sigma 54-interacting transcriptional regulator n=1 Tax=Abyssisolibacter fermentans TaxID=1766203 RepID=UPI00083089A3|nr:sigma 54-interacting transcriptional regulator [Abyssisolibacter fermentans]
MKRKEKIYNEIKVLSSKITKQDLQYNLNIGTSAQEISDKLKIARNAVSQELNTLNKEYRLIKIKSRPVLFIDTDSFENLLECKIRKCDYEVKSFERLKNKYLTTSISEAETKTKTEEDPFNRLIGNNKSLKEAIDKAKSAVLYPPNGLHVLLTGASGVGKTFFAEVMHQYYENYKHSQTSIPFVYFNCSEYYNNPELLTGQLFGYTKGAFTGATADKEGLIQKADGGFLFLDEIHRLPAEGQEKLFSILDKNQYRKLGASGNLNKVNIRLIGATTCDVNSSLLRTFLRRIQVVIEIPKLSNRTPKERLEIILKFLQHESIKTGLKIKLSYEFAYYLMTHEFEGNIGELKSEIQYKCAQAFLNVMTKGYEYIILDDTFVTEKNIYDDLKVKKLLDALFNRLEYTDITPESNYIFEKELNLQDNDSNGINFYSLLTKEYNALREKDLSYIESRLLLENKIQTLFQYTFYYKIQENKNNELSRKLIDGPMTGKINKIINKIEEITHIEFDDATKNNFYLHIYTFLSYVRNGESTPVYNTSYIVKNYKKEYDEAKVICTYMSDVFRVSCPKSELIFITLFLNALYNSNPIKNENRNCGVVIIAHGNTTASSMAGFANTLFKTEIIQPIDMPLEQSISDTLDKLIELIKDKKYEEMILLVDMGSLVSFGQVIEKNLGVKNIVIKNITTEVLLEITRKVVYDLKPLNGSIF